VRWDFCGFIIHVLFIFYIFGFTDHAITQIDQKLLKNLDMNRHCKKCTDYESERRRLIWFQPRFLPLIFMIHRALRGNSDENRRKRFCFCSFSAAARSKEVIFGAQVDQYLLYRMAKNSSKNRVLKKVLSIILKRKLKWSELPHLR
jgi:hypothetical protein